MTEDKHQSDHNEAYVLCDIGFRVYANGKVDPDNGCGHRHCYPLACERLKRIKQDERND